MKVQEAKRMLRIQEWAAQINACQRSGLTVRKWCEQQGVKFKTYYNRMRCVREEMLNTMKPADSALEALISIGEQKHIYASEQLSGDHANKITSKTEAPVFVPLSIPTARTAAVTVRLGEYAVDIQNGADDTMVQQVLRLMVRL